MPSHTSSHNEEAVFVNFLLSEFSASGNGNRKESTLNAAASKLKERFPNASGAEKTADACKNKWQSLKLAYNAVVDIKNTSEFIWSDEYGAGIWRPGAQPFKTKGFEHFSAIEQMMPKIVKGSHIYCITNPIQTSAPQPEAARLPDALTFSQLSSVTQDIIAGAQASGSSMSLKLDAMTHGPSSIAPLTPSSFLVSSTNSSAPSSVLTSVSCSAKHRMESESGGSTWKRTWLLSVHAQAQKDGSDTMKELAGYIKDFLTTSPQVQGAISSTASQDGPLGHAIILLSEHKMLTQEDSLEIVDYFARDKVQAVVFLIFWRQCKLPGWRKCFTS
ncbi:hypothetical protein EDB19DRAFT_1829543 [Suillus lakei]|nr:hypothetical protein EDB19DRAFT_1829543 [Suillus lakei]